MVKLSSEKPKSNRPRKPESRPASRAPTDEDVRARAYQIFQARGAVPGRELDDWLQAERELRGDA